MQISELCTETISQFELNQVPEELEALKKEMASSTEPYIKKTLHLSSEREVILTYWKPNQGSHIHNHGESHGKVLVVEGEILERHFKFDGSNMELLDSNTFPEKTCLDITPVNFHSMTSGDNPTTTLHIYKPKIEHMCVYNETTKKLEHVEGGKAARCEHE